MRRRAFLAAAGGTALAGTAIPGRGRTPAIVPVGALPSARQRQWQSCPRSGFVHFGMNTFTGREWGYGDDDPARFDPTDFSAEQIVSALRAGGLSGLIVTAKHHDGFCLWPSRETDYSVVRSPWRDGRGDVVGELSRACVAQGMRFGVYLSPWDRHRGDYATPAYVAHYKRQLHELLTQYGPLSEIWFDGANGGDGWYGGAREKRHIEADRYYDWPTLFAMIRTSQPQAAIFAPKGGDIRWIGNEAGAVTAPCWPTIPDVAPDPATETTRLQHGVFRGARWCPAEVDVSIRPGWFWHEGERDAVRSPANLYDLTIGALGVGANLLLNVPPDRRGRIDDADAQALAASASLVARFFAGNVAAGGSLVADGHAATQALTDDAAAWFAAADARQAALVLTLPQACVFDVVELSEPVEYGIRSRSFSLHIMDETDGNSLDLDRLEGIGVRRIVRLPRVVRARRIVLRLFSPDCTPALRFLALRKEPDRHYPPVITRDAAGNVTIAAQAGAAIAYTTDGCMPGADSPRYAGPFRFAGGVVRARVVPAAGADVCTYPVTTQHFGIPAARLRVTAASAPGAEGLFIDAPRQWISPAQGARAYVALAFEAPLTIGELVLTPGSSRPGVWEPPERVEIFIDDAAKPAVSMALANVRANDAPRSLSLPACTAIHRLLIAFPTEASAGAVAVRRIELRPCIGRAAAPI